MQPFKQFTMLTENDYERHCPFCNSTNVIIFDSDNDSCQDCQRWFPAVAKIKKPKPDYHTHLSNLIKIIESLGAEHGHSLNPEFKKQLEDAKKLIQ